MGNPIPRPTSSASAPLPVSLYSPGGGTAGAEVASFPATLESFLAVDGAIQEGAVYNLPSGKFTVQATANADAAADFACVATVSLSNDNVGWYPKGIITLSGAGATVDTAVFENDFPYAYIRVDVSGFTGTGATCTITRVI